MKVITQPFASFPKYQCIIVQRIVNEVYIFIFANLGQILMNDIGFYIA